jgi:hypothetical protein
LAALILGRPAASSALLSNASDKPTPETVYLPAVLSFWAPSACPTSSSNVYVQGTAFQYDYDNPVRPADQHADKNLALRGYDSNPDPNLKHELVAYPSNPSVQPPQLATLFSPANVPDLVGFYRVNHWEWSPSPDPGSRGGPILFPSVTALGLTVAPGEALHVPESGYTIGGGLEVLVLFADEDSVTLRYTRDDSSAPAGYTLHVDGLCTDPNLLALYSQLDDPSGPRYIYPNPTYDLPTLYAGQAIGTARETEIVVAITDTGTFMDPRSCTDWWQIRPGYDGSCPPYY